MAKSTLPPQERLSQISGYTDPHCSDAKLNDPRSQLEAYHRALLDEARSLQVESPRGHVDLQHLEAAARRASGRDKPGPVRAVILPSPGATQSSSPPRGQ